jgi:hypothetical protein
MHWWPVSMALSSCWILSTSCCRCGRGRSAVVRTKAPRAFASALRTAQRPSGEPESAHNTIDKLCPPGPWAQRSILNFKSSTLNDASGNRHTSTISDMVGSMLVAKAYSTAVASKPAPCPFCDAVLPTFTELDVHLSQKHKNWAEEFFRKMTAPEKQ